MLWVEVRTAAEPLGGGGENTRMRVVAGPVEATALGNILTQAIAMGDVESIAAGRELVARSIAQVSSS